MTGVINPKRIEAAAKAAWRIRRPEAAWDSDLGPSIPERKNYLAKAKG